MKLLQLPLRQKINFPRLKKEDFSDIVYIAPSGSGFEAMDVSCNIRSLVNLLPRRFNVEKLACAIGFERFTFHGGTSLKKSDWVLVNPERIAAVAPGRQDGAVDLFLDDQRRIRLVVAGSLEQVRARLDLQPQSEFPPAPVPA